MLDLPRDQLPQPTRLADYRPPDFLIDKVELEFFLAETGTTVTSHMQLRRNPDAGTPKAPLRLDGEELELVSLALGGVPLALGDYQLKPDGALIIAEVPDAFMLDVEISMHPENNTQLS